MSTITIFTPMSPVKELNELYARERTMINALKIINALRLERNNIEGRPRRFYVDYKEGGDVKFKIDYVNDNNINQIINAIKLHTNISLEFGEDFMVEKYVSQEQFDSKEKEINEVQNEYGKISERYSEVNKELNEVYNKLCKLKDELDEYIVDKNL